MDMPQNIFKGALAKGATQFGLWVSLADPVAGEIAAGAGFDWLLIDGEHAPNDLRTILVQLQAMGSYDVTPIVRPVRGEASLIKQLLDLGAQTILVPMVESATEARALVACVRYPPGGRRGVATARASRWGRFTDYWARADEEICLIVQVETQKGLSCVREIAAVEGVDAVFIGPSDLGASLGHLGQANAPAVVDAVIDAITSIRSVGTPAGVLATDSDVVRRYEEAGASFIGVGVDTLLLATETSALAQRFRRPAG